MASTSQLPIWAEDNPDQQQPLVLVPGEQLYNLIMKKMPELCKTVTMSGLWKYLIALRVVDSDQKEELQMKQTMHQVQEFLLNLQKGPTWQFHAFCYALCQDNQLPVVCGILGLNPDDYLVCDEDSQEDVASSMTKTERAKLKRAIKAHRSYYGRTMMKGRLLDIPSVDRMYDVKDCWIEVEIASDELKITSKMTPPVDMLKCEPGKAIPKTAILSGPPGAGKSAIVRYYVYKWTQTKEGEGEWDLIVILNVSTLELDEKKSPTDNVMDAIRQSIEVKDSDIIMKGLRNGSLKVLIIPDGMDECRNTATKAMLKELVCESHKEGLGMSVLATCRTELCPFRYDIFDKRMKTEGFTRKQGIEYVEKYYNRIQQPTDKCVHDVIATSEGELDHILTNPLCTHILSVVTADGTLKLEKGQGLKLKELFGSMEDSMKRRQKEKTVSPCSDSESDEDREIDTETRNFYLMSLYALLTDVRTFKNQIFKMFNLKKENIYSTFMSKQKIGIRGKQEVWCFNHEMFHEYFSARALEILPENITSSLLFRIASQEKYRNTQRILFSILGNDIEQHEKLADMIQANLVLQKNARNSRSIPEQIQTIMKMIDRMADLPKVFEKLVARDTSLAETDGNATWYKIRSEFEHMVQKNSHFAHHQKALVVKEDYSNVCKHVYRCFQEIPKAKRTSLFNKTIGRFLIKDGAQGSKEHLYLIGGTTWSSIVEDIDSITVHVKSGSATNATDAVRQHRQYRYPDDTVRELVSIKVDTCSPHLQLDTKEDWSQLVSALSDLPVTAGRLHIEFDEYSRSSQCYFLNLLLEDDFSDNLKKLVTEGDDGTPEIVVHGDWGDWSQMQIFHKWAEQIVQQQRFHIILDTALCEPPKGLVKEAKVYTPHIRFQMYGDSLEESQSLNKYGLETQSSGYYSGSQRTASLVSTPSWNQFEQNLVGVTIPNQSPSDLDTKPGDLKFPHSTSGSGDHGATQTQSIKDKDWDTIILSSDDSNSSDVVRIPHPGGSTATSADNQNDPIMPEEYNNNKAEDIAHEPQVKKPRLDSQ